MRWACGDAGTGRRGDAGTTQGDAGTLGDAGTGRRGDAGTTHGDAGTGSDVRSAARAIVIGQTIADSLFSGMDPVGQTVRVMNLPFRVVGVMARKGQDPQGRDQDDTAFAPFTSVQKKLLGNNRLPIAYVSAISQDATYTAQAQIVFGVIASLEIR